MSKKITHFGKLCVTYVLVFAIVFSFVMSSFVGLDIKVFAETNSTTPSESDLLEGNNPGELDDLAVNGHGTTVNLLESNIANQHSFTSEDKNTENVTFVGKGDISDPYQITNAAELWKAVHNTDPTKYFMVMNDIVINNTVDFATWDDSLDLEDWNPTAKFAGFFDGNNKTIYGLYSSTTVTKENKFVGLFARLESNAIVYNVILDNAYVSASGNIGMSSAGALIGGITKVSNVLVYGCAVKNSVVKNGRPTGSAAAGLVGSAYSNTGAIKIENCYAVDTTVSDTGYSAGIAAAEYDANVSIKNCFTTDNFIGGDKYANRYVNCYTTGDSIATPFKAASTGNVFYDTSELGKVYKINKGAMKGANALENMKLSLSEWTVTESYPIAKHYVIEKNIWDGEKSVTSFAQLDGEGTAEKPYRITNAAELWFAVNNTAKIGVANDKIPYFRLENDIQLNAIAHLKGWDIEAPANTWLPTGTFVGHFDGNYKTISGLYAAPSTDTSAGLFASVDSDSTIQNLSLVSSYIKAAAGSSATVVGGIVGKIDGEANVTLTGLSVKNATLEGNTTGGIVGRIANSTGVVVVQRCSALDNTLSANAAGLVGDIANNDVDTVVVSHSFTTGSYVAGKADKAKFNVVYTTNDIAKPFATEDTTFDATSIKAIALADMKGDNAVTAMGLDASYWATVADSYPVVKPYDNTANDFKAEDKTKTLADLKGTGTKADPYQITDAAQLWVAVNNTNKDLFFKVMNDITINDTTAFAAWDDSSSYENWNPTEKFVGYFDGNKKVISGLYVSTSSDKYLGLFARVGDEAKIIDVIVEKAYLSYTGTSSMTFVGGLIGNASGVNDVSVYGCAVRDSKIANKHTNSTGEGGLIGTAYGKSGNSITIKNCYAVDNILSGIAAWSSGLVAAHWTQNVTLVDCFTTGKPLGHLSSGVVSAKNCYVAGDVDYPFSIDPKGEFGDSTGIYKIDYEKMKGKDALTNMNFSSYKWEATDGYPVSKIKFEDGNGSVGTPWSGATAKEFAGGSGTEKDPWLIDTPERLAAMVNTYGTTEYWFKITADIIINDTSTSDWYTSEQVQAWPVGKKFVGHVDGQGYTISGLYIDNSAGSTAGAGLIPQAKTGATIANINIDKCYAKSNPDKDNYTGIIVGFVGTNTLLQVSGCNVTNALIDNCYSFGGIVGSSSTGVCKIDYCTFEGSKLLANYPTDYIGGIIGNSWGPIMVSNCVSKGVAAVGKGNVPVYAVYSDVSQSETNSKNADVIQLNPEEMIGSAAKEFMTKLNWNCMQTNKDGLPTAKHIDLSTDIRQGAAGKVWSGLIAPGYAGGDGTENAPYLIETPEQLYRFSLESMMVEKKVDSVRVPVYYKITEDIYLNDVSDENWKEKDNLNNWMSSCNGAGKPPFYGHLDGDYHVIYGLYANHNSVVNSCALIPRAQTGSTISRVGLSDGYMINLKQNENYSAGFVGFIKSKGTKPITEYIPVKFSECFVDDSFEVYSYYAGGFVGGAPVGVDFENCYSNAFIGNGALYSGAFIGNAWYTVYPTSFHECYAYPASKWTQFSEVILAPDPETGKDVMPEGKVRNSYYFGSSLLEYFDLLFYQYMHGDLAKENMKGFDFDNVWQTVEGGTPVLKGFKSDKFSSTRDVYTTVKFVTGTEEVTVPSKDGIALTTLGLPVPEREGYIFDGWYVYEEGNCEYDYGIYPVVDTTLYAKWVASSVSQNFENFVNTEFDYQDDYVYYRPGVAGYSSLMVHGGSKAFLRKGESADEQDLIINATEPIAAGEEYKIRFWVATDSADTKATISLVHYTWPDFQDPSLGVEKMVDVESLEVGEWTVYTYKFKAKTPWVGIRTTGNARIYMDDFFITPVADTMKDPNKVNDYEYFYNLGEKGKNATAQTLNGVFQTPVQTLAPTSEVSTEETKNTIALLASIILATSALIVLSRVYFVKEAKKDIEE